MVLEIDIQAALQKPLEDYCNAQVIPLKVDNIIIATPSDGKYVAASLLPNDPLNLNWSDFVERGIYNILVHTAVNTGYGAATTLRDAIRALYWPGSMLFSGSAKLSIYKPCKAGSCIPSGQEAIFPLTVYYQSIG